MLKQYPSFDKGSKNKKGEIELFYDKLPKKEQELLSDYINYRKARGGINPETAGDIRRYLLHLRFILEKKFDNLTLKELRELLAIINDSRLSDYARNDVKINLKNFLKWKFKDWSERFADLEDIRLTSNPRNEKKLNAQVILKPEDIKEIMKHETRMFWKALFLTQWEAGLRTKEIRLLSWDSIKFNIDGDISEINIFATKTKRARTLFVKEATHYLKLLKEEQEKTDQKGIYVFHSPKDINKPIDKSNVAKWMRILSKKTGIVCWNYLLRHSRATELYRLAKQGKISKDIAMDFMGHSASMSEVYTHLDESEIKKMLKDQIFKLEDLPPEKKNEYEQKIKELQEKIKKMQANTDKRLISIEETINMMAKLSELG